MITYYDILGVSESASAAEIQTAYKNQVKQYHPDKSDHPDSNDLFIDLQKAKENLPQTTRPIENTLNYRWENGEPIEPISDNNETRDEDTDTNETYDPWGSANTAHTDPNPNDKSNVNVEDDTNSKTQSTGNDDTWSNPSSEDTREKQDTRTDDTNSRSTANGNSVGSTAWHKLVIGSTVTQAVYFLGGSSGSSLLFVATVFGWIGLPVGIYFDSKLTSKFTGWPEYKLAYLLPCIVPGIAVIPGLLYLWKRSSKVDSGSESRHDQLSATKRVRFLLTRRNAIGAAIGGGLLFMLGNRSTETEASGSPVGDRPQEVTVTDPSESIQDAINTVASGGTVRINPGVYAESIDIEKNITIISSEGATLEGSDIDVDVGVSVDNSTVTIDGLSVAGFYSGISGGGQDANIAISNLELDNDEFGVHIEANALDLSAVTAREHDSSGAYVSSTRNGNITVSDCIIETSGQNRYSDLNDGLIIEGAKQILIENSEFADNGDSSVVINSGNVDGQSIEITNTVTVDSGNTGIYIEGTRGSDDVVISDVESTRDGTGIWIGEESRVASVEIQSVEMRGHDNDGIEIHSIREGTVDISNTFVDHDSDNYYADGTPLLLEGGQNISIQDSEFLSGTENNIQILSGSTNGQNISIANTDSATTVNGDGITYEGSRGEDRIEISNADIVNNNDYGIDIAGEQVTLDRVTATGNGDSGLNLRDIDRSEATITNSTLGG